MGEKREFVSYLHSFNMGDLLSILPGVRQRFLDSGQKGFIYQRLGLRGEYYPGAVHPVINNAGEMVTFNKYMLMMATPLIKFQEYVHGFKEWEGEDIIVNFDKIRSECFANLPYGEIKRWTYYCYPDLATDLSQKWLTVPDQKDERTEGKLIVNMSERYRNNLINYFFLKEYEGQIVFTGTEHECDLFNEKWKLNIPYLEVTDFLDLAISINSCKAFLGSQSMQFQIAEGLKIPRIVEACSFAPNVIPQGANGYDFYHNGAVEYYVKKLML